MQLAANPTGVGAALTVRAAGTTFALALADVAEVIRPLPVTRVPHAPASLLGLANLRGGVLPVVSLPRLLGHGSEPGGAGARIVVVPHGGGLVGVWVEALATQNGAGGLAPLPINDLLAREFGGQAFGPARSVHQTAGPALLAAVAPADAAPRQILVLASFRVSGQDYAMRLADVREIVAYPREIAAPGRADPLVVGLATVRGAVLPLVSLRALLGVAADGVDAARAHLVITRIGAAQVGLIVDELRAVLRVPADSVDAVPPVLTRGTGETRIEAICRLPDCRGLVALLSPRTLFDAATTARLAVLDAGAVAPSEARGTAAETQQFLIFQLGAEEYGLPAGVVDEVARCPAVLARLPRAPAFVDGIMNVRGTAVPVIDQGARLAAACGRQSGATAPQGGLVIIITVHGTKIGLRVDAVRKIRSVAAAELRPAPAVVPAGEALFDRVAIDPAGGRMILLIDPAALLNGTARDLLAALPAPSGTLSAAPSGALQT
jgi:purine-binding chemotaxis protein CheW